MANCHFRLKRHVWERDFLIGGHKYKICQTCGKMVMTHHVSCSIHCMSGPM